MLYVSIIILSALLYTYYHFRDRVPILMYHRIASVPGDRNALPEEKFEEQMRYLEENGFHSYRECQYGHRHDDPVLWYRFDGDWR